MKYIYERFVDESIYNLYGRHYIQDKYKVLNESQLYEDYMVLNIDNKDSQRFLKNHNWVSCDINVDMVIHNLD